MRIDIQKLLDDFGIASTTSGKHARPGWIQIECPFCTGNPGWHGGFHISKNYYNCWRCGWHDLTKIISQLIGQNHVQIKRLLKSYKQSDNFEDSPQEKIRPSISKLNFPSMTKPMVAMHKDYLISRNFDPYKLEKDWGLLGTGPLSFSRIGADYKFRIIAPIYYHNQLVSYQGRDVTGKSDLKYKACPKEEEIMHHKHLLYGLDKVRGNRILVLEGITDVWRIGLGTVATFGIEWTKEQAALLSTFDKVFIMYDPEPQAQAQASNLLAQMFDGELINLAFGDPAEMNEIDVSYLRKELKLQ